jgi:hypothetical protein
MEYADHLAALADTAPALAAELAPLRNLEAVLGWMSRAGVPFASIDLVQQDEYCYDLLAALPGDGWLALGVT